MVAVTLKTPNQGISKKPFTKPFFERDIKLKKCPSEKWPKTGLIYIGAVFVRGPDGGLSPRKNRGDVMSRKETTITDSEPLYQVGRKVNLIAIAILGLSCVCCI